jgi:hypothetical protein
MVNHKVRNITPFGCCRESPDFRRGRHQIIEFLDRNNAVLSTMTEKNLVQAQTIGTETLELAKAVRFRVLRVMLVSDELEKWQV